MFLSSLQFGTGLHSFAEDTSIGPILKNRKDEIRGVVVAVVRIIVVVGTRRINVPVIIRI